MSADQRKRTNADDDPDDFALLRLVDNPDRFTSLVRAYLGFLATREIHIQDRHMQGITWPGPEPHPYDPRDGTPPIPTWPPFGAYDHEAADVLREAHPEIDFSAYSDGVLNRVSRYCLDLGLARLEKVEFYQTLMRRVVVESVYRITPQGREWLMGGVIGGAGAAGDKTAPGSSAAGESNASRGNGLSLLQWMGAKSATLAVVFTDIIDSAKLCNSLGEERYTKIKQNHFTKLRALLAEYEGIEVKDRGDGKLLVFRTAEKALSFGLALQQNTGDEKIKVKIGINVGTVTEEGGDLRQNAVLNLAARLTDYSDGRSVLCTDVAYNDIIQRGLSAHQQIGWTPAPAMDLKGFDGPQSVWCASPSD